MAVLPLDTLNLEPLFEQCHLPEFRAAQRRQAVVRCVQERVDVRTLEQPALPCRPRIQGVGHHIEIRPRQMLQGGDRKIALRPIDRKSTRLNYSQYCASRMP